MRVQGCRHKPSQEDVNPEDAGHCRLTGRAGEKWAGQEVCRGVKITLKLSCFETPEQADSGVCT